MVAVRVASSSSRCRQGGRGVFQRSLPRTLDVGRRLLRCHSFIARRSAHPSTQTRTAVMAALDAALSTPSDARDTERAQPPQCTIRLVSREGVEVVILGTAHVSRSSEEEARLLVRELRPAVVFVELCPRYMSVSCPFNVNALQLLFAPLGHEIVLFRCRRSAVLSLPERHPRQGNNSEPDVAPPPRAAPPSTASLFQVRHLPTHTVHIPFAL